MSIKRNWFSSDLHLGHQRVIELCDRPFESVEEMNERIIANFNDVAGKGSRLVLMGDTCMGQLAESLEWLGKLEADEVILIPGNHDRWSMAYEHRGDSAQKRFEFKQRYEAALGGRGVAMFDWAPSIWHGLFSLTGDWAHVGEPWSLVEFSHYPYKGKGDSHEGDDRYNWLRGEDNGLPLVCGHVHGAWKHKEKMFNVGVDVNDFKPVSEDEVLAWLESLRD